MNTDWYQLVVQRLCHFPHVYVGRNLWIGDIHGSACAIYGSILCAEIHGLRRYLWIAHGSCLRGPREKFAGPVSESHFFKLIFLDSLHYMFGQLFPTYQSGAKRKCVIIVILRQVPALSACREAVPTPTVCDCVTWIVAAH